MAGTNSTPEGIYDLLQEVDMHLIKASGIVHLFSVGKVDEEVADSVHSAAWSAHGHIEDCTGTRL